MDSLKEMEQEVRVSGQKFLTEVELRIARFESLPAEKQAALPGFMKQMLALKALILESIAEDVQALSEMQEEMAA